MKRLAFKKAALLSLMAFGLLFAQAGAVQAKMPMIPQCVAAWNALGKAKMLGAAKQVITTDCAIMYKSKWLVGKGVVNQKACAPAWNALGKAKMLAATRELITRNCPVLYKQKWLKP
ncbi:MAG: hypothetical protein RIB59_16905 [Rhodospirillales bacterium]